MAQPPGEEYEPRFAGSVPAGYVAPGMSPSPWAQDAAAPMGYAPQQPTYSRPPLSPPPLSPPPLAPPPGSQPPTSQPQDVLSPEVSYWTDEPAPAASRSISVDLRGAIGLLVAVIGGVLAVVSSQLNWASLKLETGTALSADSASSVTYPGSALIEGRLLLAAGVLAIVFSVLVLLGRPLVIGVWATGAAGFAVTAFAAISHPADLATLLHVNEQVDDVTVSAPNGSGVWLALAGAALILIGGLVAHYLRNFRGQQYSQQDQQISPASAPGVY
jgi:hypothetical protein